MQAVCSQPSLSTWMPQRHLGTQGGCCGSCSRRLSALEAPGMFNLWIAGSFLATQRLHVVPEFISGSCTCELDFIRPSMAYPPAGRVLGLGIRQLLTPPTYLLIWDTSSICLHFFWFMASSRFVYPGDGLVSCVGPSYG